MVMNENNEKIQIGKSASELVDSAKKNIGESLNGELKKFNEAIHFREERNSQIDREIARLTAEKKANTDEITTLNGARQTFNLAVEKVANQSPEKTPRPASNGAVPVEAAPAQPRATNLGGVTIQTKNLDH